MLIENENIRNECLTFNVLTSIKYLCHVDNLENKIQVREIFQGADLGYIPFTRENRKFQLENQMDRAIPFGKLQRIWAVI